MRRNIDGHVGPNWLAKSLVTIVKVVRSEQIEKFEKVEDLPSLLHGSLDVLGYPIRLVSSHDVVGPDDSMVQLCQILDQSTYPIPT